MDLGFDLGVDWNWLQVHYFYERHFLAPPSPGTWGLPRAGFTVKHGEHFSDRVQSQSLLLLLLLINDPNIGRTWASHMATITWTRVSHTTQVGSISAKTDYIMIKTLQDSSLSTASTVTTFPTAWQKVGTCWVRSLTSPDLTDPSGSGPTFTTIENKEI